MNVTEHAQQLDSQAVSVSRLAGDLAAAAEHGASPQELRDLHDELARQVEALNGLSSLMAVALADADRC